MWPTYEEQNEYWNDNNIVFKVDNRHLAVDLKYELINVFGVGADCVNIGNTDTSYTWAIVTERVQTPKIRRNLYNYCLGYSVAYRKLEAEHEEHLNNVGH